MNPYQQKISRELARFKKSDAHSQQQGKKMSRLKLKRTDVLSWIIIVLIILLVIWFVIMLKGG